MSEKRSTKPNKRRPKSNAKAIRNAKIVEEAMTGKEVQQIAQEMGLHRSTVSEVLNSDEVKALVATINGKLATGIDDAIRTVKDLAKSEYEPARDLLRNFGAMQPKVEVEHSGVVKLENLVAGSNEGDDGKED